jgi:hypothetical protein
MASNNELNIHLDFYNNELNIHLDYYNKIFSKIFIDNVIGNEIMKIINFYKENDNLKEEIKKYYNKIYARLINKYNIIALS